MPKVRGITRKVFWVSCGSTRKTKDKMGKDMLF